MSDFETVALIVIFLVLSAIIVRLIGGGADTEPLTRYARSAAHPLPNAVSAPSAGSQLQRAAVAPRTEPAKPQPIEPAMVKVDLPPPTVIPARVAAQQQQFATAAPAAVRPAAPSQQTVTQQQSAAAPVASAPTVTVVTRSPEPTPAKAAAQPQNAAPVLAAAPIRPSAAATVAPAATAQSVQQAAPPPAAPKPAVRAEPPPVQVATQPPAPVRATSVASGPVTIMRRDVKATLAPGATLGTTAPAATFVAAKRLSAEDQAILSRYLRPDVKATLFRDFSPDAPASTAPPRVVTPAPQSAPSQAPRAPVASAPLVISKPSAAGTLPPGYAPPKTEAKVAGPVGASTGFAPLGLRPDAKATLASYVAETPAGTSGSAQADAPQAAANASTAAPVRPAMYAAATGAAAAAASAHPAASIEPSPRAARAESIPPSTAVNEAAAPSAQQPAAQLPVSDTTLLSTAKRGTRVIGAEAAAGELIDLERPAAPRPQTSSIWSNTVPRRSVTDSEILDPDSAAQLVNVRAERVPVRAGTILVRPDASRTIDPSAPKYMPLPTPPPVASLRTEARSQPEAGNYANVQFTLPPGALGEE